MPSDIEVIQFVDASGNLVKSYAAPFKIKQGSNISFSVVDGKLVITGSAGGVTAHSALTQLDYASAGHTGFQPALGFTAENAANKGAISGYAPLGVDQKVPTANLPALGTTDHAALSHLDYPSAGHTGVVPYANLPWDNAQKNMLPTNAGTLALWLRADLGVTKDGSNKVSVWADQSGNNRNYTQATGGNQPVWTASGIGGQNSIAFTGASSHWIHCETFGSWGDGYPYTLFIVFHAPGGGSMCIWSVGKTGYAADYRIVNYTNLGFGIWGTMDGSKYVNQQIAPAALNPILLTYYTNPNSTKVSIREAGRELITDADNNFNTYLPQGYNLLGAATYNGYTPNLFFTGQIAEVILYRTPISPKLMSKVEDYLTTRYSLGGPYVGYVSTPPTPRGGTGQAYYGYTLTDHDFYMQGDASIGSLVVTLPNIGYSAGSVRCNGYIYIVQKIDSSANTVTVQSNATDHLENNIASIVLSKQWDMAMFVGGPSSASGTWYIVNPNSTDLGLLISRIAAKTTPVDADKLALSDSAASNVLKSLSWSDLKAGSKTYFDTLYAVYSAKVKFTPEGGLAIKVTNKTGANSVKGYVVRAGSSVDNSVELVVVDVPDAIGAIYEDGIADGQEIWVVVSGIADVYYGASTTRNYVARTLTASDSFTTSGYAIAQPIFTPPFATDKHFMEIGHVLESRTGAGLAKTVLHFN